MSQSSETNMADLNEARLDCYIIKQGVVKVRDLEDHRVYEDQEYNPIEETNRVEPPEVSHMALCSGRNGEKGVAIHDPLLEDFKPNSASDSNQNSLNPVLMEHQELGHLPKITGDDTNILIDPGHHSSLAPPNATRYPPISQTISQNPSLPAELLLMVWDLTFKPRFVQWRAGGAKPPTLLHVYRASRTHVLKSYVMCDVGDSQSKDVIFLNPEVDILYCTDISLIPPPSPPTDQAWHTNLAKIAIPFSEARLRLRSPRPAPTTAGATNLFEELAALFPNLQKLLIVVGVDTHEQSFNEDTVLVEDEVSEFVMPIGGMEKNVWRLFLDATSFLATSQSNGILGGLEMKFMRMDTEDI